MAGPQGCLVRTFRAGFVTPILGAGGGCANFTAATREWGEKKMIKHRGGAATLLVTALALGACGGGDDPRLTKAQYVEQGSAICGQTSARIEEAAQGAFNEPGKIPTPEEITDFATGTVAPAIEEEVEQLRELRPPEDDEERIDDVLRAGRDGVDTVRQDPTIILNSTDDGFGRYQELSAAYGLQNCGGGSDATRDAISGITSGG